MFGSSLKSALGLGEAVGEDIAGGKTAVPEENVGMGRDKFLGYLDCSFKAACTQDRNAS